jgi:hypothetical protein
MNRLLMWGGNVVVHFFWDTLAQSISILIIWPLRSQIPLDKTMTRWCQYIMMSPWLLSCSPGDK